MLHEDRDLAVSLVSYWVDEWMDGWMDRERER